MTGTFKNKIQFLGASKREKMQKQKILIVDDRPENLLSLELLLEEIDCEVIRALSGNEALIQISRHNISLVLLDVQMPHMDGFETAELMRNNKRTSHVPIIFVTAISKEQSHVFHGYKSGAVDYICKPFEPGIILAKVSVFLELDRYRRSLEDAHHKLEQQKNMLEQLAITDELTGLYNRRYLKKILHQEFERSKRYNSDFSILMLDLDHFKAVNDSYGHGFGDHVLREFAGQIDCSIRASDSAFRFGGEEIMILLPNTDIKGAQRTAENIRLQLAGDPIEDTNHSATVTVSIGVTSYLLHKPEDGNELVTFADKALYSAKEKGRNRVEVYCS
jgi:diguanylate cyclase (GGDEF)-like protein